MYANGYVPIKFYRIILKTVKDIEKNTIFLNVPKSWKRVLYITTMILLDFF